MKRRGMQAMPCAPWRRWIVPAVWAAAMLSALPGRAQDTTAVEALPEPAEIAPLAQKGLLLDVATTGQGLIAVGERGTIIASKDGQHWSQTEVPVRATLTAVSFADARQGWAVGHDAAIVHTQDGGSSWSLQHFKPELRQPLLDVLFVDSRRGYAVGAFGLFLQTTDGGVTWAEAQAPEIRDEGLHLNSIVRLDDGGLLIVGESGMMAHSIDGTAWRRLTSPYEGSFFGAIPYGEHGAIAFGLRGKVYLSRDVEGGPWTRVEAGTTASVFGGARMPGGGSVLCGADGSLVVLAADGSVKARVAQRSSAPGSSSTLAGVVPWRDGLLLVGEQGIEARSLQPQ